MAESNILYNIENRMGIITFNCPERTNRLTDGMLGDIPNILNEAAQNDEERALIVTGRGCTFCGGTDVTAGIARDNVQATDERAKKIRKVELPDTFLPVPKPVIAAVNGAVVGIGAEWTAQCDIRITSENARLVWVFPLRGITPDNDAVLYLLPYIVGLSWAPEQMYSGEIIYAREAEHIGLVIKVVSSDQLMSAAKKVAVKLTRGAPLATKGTKEVTYGSLEWPPSVHINENAKQFRSTSATEDAREGVQSFLEKREPR